jgi:hypothetical protein
MQRVRVGQSGVTGKGVFAERKIKKGEVILLMSGEQVSDAQMDAHLAAGDLRWDDPLEIGSGEYLLLDEVPLRINHSCNPNAGIRGQNELFALRVIKKGEEIFYDYSTMVGTNAPGESDWLMDCSCGTPKCRTIIGNWQTLPNARLTYYKSLGALPDFVLEQIKKVPGIAAGDF